MKRFAILLIVVLTSLFSAAAQNSLIIGSVVDEASGEPLIGANVLILGTRLGAATDMEGKFAIKNVPPGIYSIKVSYIGYMTKVIANVEVIANESTRLNVSLAEEAYKMQEIVTTAKAVRSTEASLLSERKRAAAIGDGVTAEFIKRSPDATSGDALKRVTGVALVDNKYIYVRGATDRYNLAMLDGASVSGTNTEDDKRSFDFDLVPASLLERVTVVKTATPDMAGDFTGGLVQLQTLDFPEHRVLQFSFGTSLNKLATGKTVLSSQGGQYDWLGVDDGSRKAPDQTLDGYAVWKFIPNTWSTRQIVAPLNQSISFNFGDQVGNDVFGLGYVGAFSYTGGRSRNTLYQDVIMGAGPLHFQGTQDRYSVLWGGIFNVHLRLGNFHKLSLRNSYNRAAEDEVVVKTGYDFQEREVRAYSIQWTQRSLSSIQIQGEHFFPELFRATVRWHGVYSSSYAEEPDRKRLKYQRQLGTTVPFSVPGTENNERAWVDVTDHSRGAGADIDIPILTGKFRLGGAYEFSKRDFNILFYSAELDPLHPDRRLTLLPPDSIFLPDNFRPGGFIVRRLSSAADNYDADRRVSAGYAMIDYPFQIFEERFRFVGGVRVENALLRAFTYRIQFENVITDTAELSNTDLLPSVNLTYLINNQMNLRLAYSHSVNRPELREIADVAFYDFNNYEEVRGNPHLQRALIRNYDLRWELYPEVDEIFAVSLFYKYIHNAIEQQVVWSSNPGKRWFNTPKGRNYGWELEVRKSLGFVDKWLQRLMLVGNFTRIYSSVEYPAYRNQIVNGELQRIEFIEKRSLQGQAKYMLNVGLHFTEPSIGTSLSVLYNAFGERVEAIADIREEDIFEAPRGTLDFSVTQRIGHVVNVKLTGRDVLAPPHTFFLRNGSTYKEIKVGSAYSFQVIFSF